MIFDLIWIVGFLYSTAGAFVATVFFIRSRGRVESRGARLLAALLAYSFWPMLVSDREVRRVLFHKEA